jgi:molybdopterin-guanine dinucleotide biosynthesis protein B
VRLFGVVGWKNAGKTGLMERLVAEFVSRGFSVSTVKHAHHGFDIDRPGKDSFRHRAAGAGEVLLASGDRWALMRELRGAPEPSLAELVARLAPVDLVLVEGFKAGGHPKIEVHRAEGGRPPMAPGDPTIRAVASDAPLAVPCPVVGIDDTRTIADLIARECGLDGGYDSFLVVDWSGGNDRGPTPKKDAIWAALARRGAPAAGIEPVYLRNRRVAERWIAETIAAERARGRRVLAAFDFPFGFPAGFAEAVTGAPDPLALWAWLAERIEDAPGANNRFDVAGRLNALFPGIGPFWGNGLPGRDIAHLPRKGRARGGHGMPERREVETRAPRAFPVWQLAGAGSVGSQALMGLPVLWRLRERFGAAAWPFEPLGAPVALVEIWPSLLAPEVAAVAARSGEIKDAAQVRLLAAALAGLEAGDLARMLDVHAPEEGWILGIGEEARLRAALARALPADDAGGAGEAGRGRAEHAPGPGEEGPEGDAGGGEGR